MTKQKIITVRARNGDNVQDFHFCHFCLWSHLVPVVNRHTGPSNLLIYNPGPTWPVGTTGTSGTSRYAQFALPLHAITQGLQDGHAQ
jgi:hypothetical protein